jgi:hypothetical protein
MTAKDIFNGSTGNRATILILDDATSKPKTGVAYNAAGLSVSYRIGTGSAVAITLTSGNWFEIGGGKYYVDVADSVYASGNLGALVQFYGALTDSSVYAEQHRVVAYNPSLAALGANTTTPPTASANADATLSGLTSGPTTGGNWPANSFGRQILIGSSTHRDVAVTASNHVAAVIHDLQPAVITAEDFATDAISADAVSSGAVGKIVTGVWSALTSGLSVVGSTGRSLARLIGLVQDSGGDEFTTKALNRAPSGTSTVTVLPAIGVAAGRGDRTTLVAYVAETITTSITVYQADGTTAYNLSGKTLTVIFENPKTGDDVAVVASGSITISGTDSNVVTFAYPSAATSAQRELTWTMRDASAPKTVYLRGVLEVRAAATVD